MHFLDRFLGDPSLAYLKRQQKLLERVNALEAEFEALSDSDLAATTAMFRKRLQDRFAVKAKDPLALLEVANRLKERKEINAALDELLPEAFAAVREAARRTVGQRHFDVQ